MNTTKTFIAIGIAIIIGCLLAYIFRDKEANRFRDPITFFLLIVATVIGVYLAVFYNDIQVEKDRKAREDEANNEKIQRAKKYTDVTRNNVRRFYTTVMVFSSIKGDTLKIGPLFKKNEDIFIPNFFIIENPYALEIISPETINQIGIQEANMKSELASLNDPLISNKDFRVSANSLASDLTRILTCLEDEDYYQDGIITEVELSNRYEQMAIEQGKALLKLPRIAAGMTFSK